MMCLFVFLRDDVCVCVLSDDVFVFLRDDVFVCSQ